MWAVHVLKSDLLLISWARERRFQKRYDFRCIDYSFVVLWRGPLARSPGHDPPVWFATNSHPPALAVPETIPEDAATADWLHGGTEPGETGDKTEPPSTGTNLLAASIAGHGCAIRRHFATKREALCVTEHTAEQLGFSEHLHEHLVTKKPTASDLSPWQMEYRQLMFRATRRAARNMSKRPKSGGGVLRRIWAGLGGVGIGLGGVSVRDYFTRFVISPPDDHPRRPTQ